MTKQILIVDDEKDIVAILKFHLEKLGFRILTAYNGDEALKITREEMPDLIILDYIMPKKNGLEVLKDIRENHEYDDILICFHTALDDEEHLINCLNNGADDFIIKPINPSIFVSKIKSLFRRKTEFNINSKIRLDSEKYKVYIDKTEFDLPNKEFRLLKLLYSKPEKVFTRDFIYKSVWGDDIIVGDRTIDVHIRKLREKLGANYIQTIKNVGYKFTENND